MMSPPPLPHVPMVEIGVRQVLVKEHTDRKQSPIKAQTNHQLTSILVISHALTCSVHKAGLTASIQ